LRAFDEAVWLVTVERWVGGTIGSDVAWPPLFDARTASPTDVAATIPELLVSGVKLHRKFVPNCAPDLRNVRNVFSKVGVN
jgi:hypothetical protein